MKNIYRVRDWQQQGLFFCLKKLYALTLEVTPVLAPQKYSDPRRSRLAPFFKI